MTQKEAYKIIYSWESDAGESFLEYFIGNCSNVIIPKLVLWMYRKSYITLDKLNLYSTKYINAKAWYLQPDYEVLCGYEDMYALFPYGQTDEIALAKAHTILAEFLVMQEVWVQRLYEFAYNGKGWSTVDQDNPKELKEHNKRMSDEIESWSERDDKEYETILALSIDEINERLEKEFNKKRNK